MPSENYPLTDVGTYRTLIIPVSFEANEVGSILLPALGYRSKPVAFSSCVTKTVAGSDAGTIKLLKSATELANIDVAASAALADEDSDTSVTGTVFEATEQYKITTDKSTAGGRALAYLTIEVLPSH